MAPDNATEEFRAARDFLLRYREEYTTAYQGFRWPRPENFNWALDWFDVIAEGNDRTALHIVEEDGAATKVSFASPRWPYGPTGRPTGCVTGAYGRVIASSSCSATSRSCGRRRWPR